MLAAAQTSEGADRGSGSAPATADSRDSRSATQSAVDDATARLTAMHITDSGSGSAPATADSLAVASSDTATSASPKPIGHPTESGTTDDTPLQKAMELLPPTFHIRVITVQGLLDRTQQVVVCCPRTAAGLLACKKLILVFGGDCQDLASESESSPMPTVAAAATLDNTAALLASRNPGSIVCIVRPSRYHKHIYACFDNFVVGDVFGRPHGAGFSIASSCGMGMLHLSSLLRKVSAAMVASPLQEADAACAGDGERGDDGVQAGAATEAIQSPGGQVQATGGGAGGGAGEGAPIGTHAGAATNNSPKSTAKKLTIAATGNNSHENNSSSSSSNNSTATTQAARKPEATAKPTSTAPTTTTSTTTTTTATTITATNNTSVEESRHVDSLPITLVGFSKGALVLQALIGELAVLPHMRQSPEKAAAMAFIQGVQEVVWADAMPEALTLSRAHALGCSALKHAHFRVLTTPYTRSNASLTTQASSQALELFCATLKAAGVVKVSHTRLFPGQSCASSVVAALLAHHLRTYEHV